MTQRRYPRRSGYRRPSQTLTAAMSRLTKAATRSVPRKPSSSTSATAVSKAPSEAPRTLARYRKLKRLRDAIAGTAQECQHQWECRAHGETGRQQRQRNDERRHRQITHRVALPDGQQPRLPHREHGGHDERAEADNRFRRCVKVNRGQPGPPNPGRDASSCAPRAERKTEHEHGHDD